MSLIENITAIDKDLFLFLNGLHAPWADNIMFYVSQFWVWIPLYILMILLIVRKWRKESVWIILSIIIGLVLTDQLSTLTKFLVERFRPTHNIYMDGMVHIVKGYVGGNYGFVSSHAANVFGVAMISSLFIRNKIWCISIYVWAVLVAYSRIYLGVHFPLDILGGAMLGMGISGLVYFVHLQIRKRLISEIKSRLS